MLALGTFAANIFCRFCWFGQAAGRYIQDSGGGFKQFKQVLVSHTVVNIFSIPPGIQNSGIPHYHQVLRDIGLALSKHCFQVTNAGFPVSNAEENLDPEGGPQDFQVIGNFYFGFPSFHIHNNEYNTPVVIFCKRFVNGYKS